MQQSNIIARNARAVRVVQRAKLLASISAFAAAGLCPAVTHAAETDFARIVTAVQLASDLQSQDQDINFASGKAVAADNSVNLQDLRIARLPAPLPPILSVGLVNHDSDIVRGEKALFIGYSNYPGMVERAELRLFDESVPVDGTAHAVVPMNDNGAAEWLPSAYAPASMKYVYRVYDRAGNFDETDPLPLNVLPAAALATSDAVHRPEFGTVDAAGIRGIPNTGRQPLIAYGKVADIDSILTIEGQVVPLSADGSFSVQLLQPAKCRELALSVQSSCGERESITVDQAEWTQPAMAAPLTNTIAAQGSSTVTAPSTATSGSGLEVRTLPAGATETRDHDLQVRADGQAIEPVMSIGLIGSERTVASGQPAQFQTYTNYPSYVVRGEVRIFAAGSVPDALPLAVIPTDSNGYAEWRGGNLSTQDLFYVYRVYDAKGRFDETKPEELTLVAEPVEIDGNPVSRPNFGVVDEAAIRNIPLNRTATITVSGSANPASETVRVQGQFVPIDPNGTFIAQQLVDRDQENISVTIEAGGQTTFAASRDIKVPRSDWFVVGQGDLTFRSMDGSGPAVDVSGDPLLDGNSVTSRAAFYAKGKFGDGWKLTASLDTGETLFSDMFNNLDRKDPRQLLRRLSSTEYYPTYGDDSTLVEDAPTQGQFYLKLQKADSSLMVGNYVVNMSQAELAPLDRGLFGVAVDHRSVGTTSFGERNLQVTAFASDPGTLPARDEFRGTGGSLYFLKRQDLSIGSERVRIEIRDRDTGIVLETRELRPQEDYDIDYFQGRITLLRPLASVAASNNIVRDSSASGNVPVLVVRYEYTPAVGSLDGYTVGGRGSAWVGDHLRLGVTAQRETTDAADQTLIGADAMVRITAGTYIKGEVAQTDGPAFGQANSVDGGLTFTDFNAPSVVGRKARALKLEGAVDFAQLRGQNGDQGKLSAFYETFDAGFAASSQLTQSDTTRWGLELALPVGNTTDVSASYEHLQSASAGTRKVANLNLGQQFGGGFQGSIGLRHDDQAIGLVYNSTESGSRTDLALQLDYKPVGRNWSIYGFGQVTLQADPGRRDNDRFGTGAKAEISDRMSLTAEVSGGDGGLGADLQLSRRYGNGSEAYIGYSLLADRTATGLEPVSVFNRTNSGTFTVGARHRFGSALSIYGENRIGHGGTAPSTMRSFGAKYDPNEKLSFSASFENGQVDDETTGMFKRTAGTFGFGYSTKDVQFGSNVEVRFERGVGRDQTVWLFRNSASVQLNPDWRALGRLNIAIADNDDTNIRAADYVEGVVGFAYRPILNDRLNILGRFNYFQDLGPVGQITAGGQTNSPKQRSQIVSLDVNYDLTQSLTVGAKYGYRQGSVSLDRTSDQFVSSNTHLGIIRLDWRAVKKWDVVVEGHYLSNDRAGDQRWGGLAAAYYHIDDNVKVGLGYSISDFSDDLTDQSYSSKGVFVNLLGKF